MRKELVRIRQTWEALDQRNCDEDRAGENQANLGGNRANNAQKWLLWGADRPSTPTGAPEQNRPRQQYLPQSFVCELFRNIWLFQIDGTLKLIWRLR
jgi:hypothetical protein